MSTNISLVSCLLIILHLIITSLYSNTITCLDNGLCRGQSLICNDNEDCYIRCEERNSCWYSIIQCPMNSKCDIYCGVDRNSCDDITINATHSTSLYIYCADNECDDAYIYCPHNGFLGIDHQCTLEGVKALDRVTFHTQEGFNDINIQNIELLSSNVICGDKSQYQCIINSAIDQCDIFGDLTCTTYRLPMPSPTSFPTKLPTKISTKIPTKIPTKITTLQPTQFPTFFPTKSPTNFPAETTTKSTTESKMEFVTESTTPSTTESATEFTTESTTHSPPNTPTNLAFTASIYEYGEPTNSPTFSPSRSPIGYEPELEALYHETEDPTKSPTAAPIQTYNEENKRLEFYIYYNDTNGINMVLAKWMKEQLLGTYNEITGPSYHANTEWKNGGLIHITFCVVFNRYYDDNEYFKNCQRFKQYGYDENNGYKNDKDLNNPTQFKAEYVAYGTFGIVSDEFIDSFQLFVIDTLTSYLFRSSFNWNMNDKLHSVEFDQVFEAIKVIVQPFNDMIDPSLTNNITPHLDENINIILAALLGILFALTCIVCIYFVRYHHIQRIERRKAKNKEKKKKKQREKASMSFEGKARMNRNNSDIPTDHEESINLKNTMINGIDCAEPDYYKDAEQQQLKIKTEIISNNNKNIDDQILNNIINHNNQFLREPDSYYLGKLQKGYLSTDGESETSEEDEEERKKREKEEKQHEEIEINIDNELSDSGDTRSVISSIISFGRRNKSKSKKKQKNQKNQKNQKKSNQSFNDFLNKNIKHNKYRRATTSEIPDKQKQDKLDKEKREQQEFDRKRSLHWGFTDDGMDKNGEKTRSNSHIKSQSAFMVNPDIPFSPTLPELDQSIHDLEIQRKSSYQSYHSNINLQICGNSVHSNMDDINPPHLRIQNDPNTQYSQYLSVNIFDHQLNDEDYLKTLSPSIKSMEDMYNSPDSLDGAQQWTTGQPVLESGFDNNSIMQCMMLNKPLSPIKNVPIYRKRIELHTIPHIVDDNNNDNNNNNNKDNDDQDITIKDVENDDSI